MKIVQKILSHGLLIAFIAAAFFAYTNRAEWFPQWLGKTGKVAQQVTDTPPDVSAPSVAGEGELETAPRHEPEASDAIEPVAEPTGRQPPDDDAAKPQSEAVDTEPDQSSVVTVPEAVVLPPQADTATHAAEKAEKAEVVASAGTDATAVQAGGADRVKESLPQAVSPADVQLEKQLEEARRRYWQGDLRGAATAYRALSKDYPENPDVWGEMGNFYFSLRQREPAAAAYLRCAELLVDQGEQIRARQLLNALYYLDAIKARELATRMEKAGG